MISQVDSRGQINIFDGNTGYLITSSRYGELDGVGGDSCRNCQINAQCFGVGTKMGSIFYIPMTPKDDMDGVLFNEKIENKIGNFRVHEMDVNTLSSSFSIGDERSKLLVSGSKDGTVKLFNCNKLSEPLGTFKKHESAVTCVELIESSRKFASGSFDSYIWVYDTINKLAIFDLDRHKGKVNDISYKSAGDSLYTCSDDGYFHFYDLRNRPRNFPKGKLYDPLTCICAEMSTSFVVGNDRGQLYCIDTRKWGKVLWKKDTHRGRVNRIIDNTLNLENSIVTCSSDKFIKVVDLFKGNVVREMKVLNGVKDIFSFNLQLKRKSFVNSNYRSNDAVIYVRNKRKSKKVEGKSVFDNSDFEFRRFIRETFNNGMEFSGRNASWYGRTELNEIRIKFVKQMKDFMTQLKLLNFELFFNCLKLLNENLEEKNKRMESLNDFISENLETSIPKDKDSYSKFIVELNKKIKKNLQVETHESEKILKFLKVGEFYPPSSYIEKRNMGYVENFDKFITYFGVILNKRPDGRGYLVQKTKKGYFSPTEYATLFIGNFKGGIKEGIGKEYLTNGVYEGNFVQNQREGKGRLFVHEKRQCIEGIWEKNELVKPKVEYRYSVIDYDHIIKTAKKNRKWSIWGCLQSEV